MMDPSPDLTGRLNSLAKRAQDSQVESEKSVLGEAALMAAINEFPQIVECTRALFGPKAGLWFVTPEARLGVSPAEQIAARNWIQLQNRLVFARAIPSGP